MRTKEQKKTYEMDMCSGSILKKMLIFTIPLMCSSILQLLFNAADIVVVGRFAGDNSLAAVGSNTALINLLTNLFVGLSIGANVAAARFYGAKQDGEVKKTVHTAMLLSIFSGIILTVIGVIGARQILIWMQTPSEVLELAVLYLRIYFVGMTGTMIYNFGSALLRAVGDTKRPLYYLFGAGCVNIVLNLLFVICFHMDVAGVALATVISEAISALLVLRCMIKEKGSIHLELRELHIYPDKFVQILKVGLPAGFQGIVFALSNVVIQSSINLFGATVVAGNSAAANIEGFVYMAMNSFYQATISFTSQNFGAGKQERINRIALTGEFCVIVVGLVFGNACVLFGHPLLGIYSSSPAGCRLFDHADDRVADRGVWSAAALARDSIPDRPLSYGDDRISVVSDHLDHYFIGTYLMFCADPAQTDGKIKQKNRESLKNGDFRFFCYFFEKKY